jgi:hypothetical protein
MDSTYVPPVAFAIVWLGSVLVVVIVLRRLLKLIARLIRESQLFGDTIHDYAVGFLAAAMIVWTAIPWMGWALVRLVLYLVRDLPGTLREAFDQSVRTCGGGEAGVSVPTHQCAEVTFMHFSRQWTTVTASLVADLGDVPYLRLVFFFLVAAIVGQLVAGAGKQAKEKGPLIRPFALMPEGKRQNTMLGMILLIAGYFSIAAITAIPDLTERSVIAEASKPEKLEEEFKAAAVIPTFSEPADPFAALRTVVEDWQSKTPPIAAATATPVDPAAILTPTPVVIDRKENAAAILQDLDDIKTSRLSAMEVVRDAHKNFERASDQARRTATTVYKQNLETRKGSRERANHFASLVGWFGYSFAQGADSIHSCERAFRSADAEAQSWASRVTSVLRRNENTPWRWWAQDSPRQGFDNLYPRYSETYRACYAVTSFQRMPEREDLGDTLGPFRVVAQWLVKTESLPLALIVGLIGFGLLGSACSTFVREQGGRKRTAGEPLVADLGGVIIRGASAAVVVFLAVVGGLTIFGGDTSDPNPYILLLTCLVAAVFSERVWEWARERVLGGLDSGRPEPTPKAEEEPAAT